MRKDQKLLLLIGKPAPTDPDVTWLTAIGNEELKTMDVKLIASRYRFVLIHRSTDADLVPDGRGLISATLVKEMPGRVGFVSAGGEPVGDHLGLPLLGRVSSSDDVVRAVRRSSLSMSFKGNAQELVQQLAQMVPEWEAHLKACGILLQGIWALMLAEASANNSPISVPVLEQCKRLGFLPFPELPRWTCRDRDALVRSFVETIERLLDKAPPNPTEERESEWKPFKAALSGIKTELTKSTIDWSSSVFAQSLTKATEETKRLCRNYLG